MLAPVQLLQPPKPWTDLQEVQESQPLLQLHLLCLKEVQTGQTDKPGFGPGACGSGPPWGYYQGNEKSFPAPLPGRSLICS